MHRLSKKSNARVETENRLERTIAIFVLVLGLVLLLLGIIYNSTVPALAGISLTFWGAALLYIAPRAQAKQVSTELLNAIALSGMTIIEKLLFETGLSSKGVYLSPKYLKDYNSSLVFIPFKEDQTVPKPEEVDEEKPFSENPKGIFLTPPSYELSKLMEKRLETSFTRLSLDELLMKLPKLLVEDLEIAQDVDAHVQGDVVTLEITDNSLQSFCDETRKLPELHEAVGCLLSSAVACALAKSTGKPVKIESEETVQKLTRIKYLIMKA